MSGYRIYVKPGTREYAKRGGTFGVQYYSPGDGWLDDPTARAFRTSEAAEAHIAGWQPNRIEMRVVYYTMHTD